MEDSSITVVGDSDPGLPSSSVSLRIAPRSVGRYLLLDEVGKGGMGTVHSAFDPELERTVAIKLIYADKEPQDRLRREAQAIARV
ncbi:MAG: hypothetical protein KC431_01215, partial [Myxococcales bacterium]|nr:hypothetical protein [Myxococcales bacterium]